MTQPPAPSLLHPPGAAPASNRPALSADDLGLHSIVRALDYDGRHGRFVSGVLAELVEDPAVIAYRQEILADLLELPGLCESYAAILPKLADLAEVGRTRRWGDDIPLVQVADRLAELENYLACVEALWAGLDAAGAAGVSRGRPRAPRLPPTGGGAAAAARPARPGRQRDAGHQPRPAAAP